ncbi:MAG: GNAT family N-acetyltransferase [Lachnospiraceae bacterium]
MALANDQFKGKGYGTLVEKNILDYGFNELGLTVIYADTLLRNVRSQHVLEKIGFRYICEDKDFKYYKYSNVTVM